MFLRSNVAWFVKDVNKNAGWCVERECSAQMSCVRGLPTRVRYAMMVRRQRRGRRGVAACPHEERKRLVEVSGGARRRSLWSCLREVRSHGSAGRIICVKDVESCIGCASWCCCVRRAMVRENLGGNTEAGAFVLWDGGAFLHEWRMFDGRGSAGEQYPEGVRSAVV